MTQAYNPNPGHQATGGGDDGMALAIGSLVCGLVSLPLCCCCGWIGLPLSAVGGVLGWLAIKTPSRNLALAGFIISMVSLVFNLIWLGFWLYSLTQPPEARMQEQKRVLEMLGIDTSNMPQFEDLEDDEFNYEVPEGTFEDMQNDAPAAPADEDGGSFITPEPQPAAPAE